MKLYCEECNNPMYSNGAETSTLVAYMSPVGHNHDDNCIVRFYECENGHYRRVSRINKCSDENCNWKGRGECFCCDGKKFSEWPE